jgi:hypothetical protein
VTTDVLFGYVYMAEEPGAHTEVLAPALRALSEAVGVPPRKMTEFGRKSRHRGERKFSWEWFEEAMGRAEHISLWGGPARNARSFAYLPTELRVRINLRYFYNIEMRFQDPRLVYAIVPTSDDPDERRVRVEATALFLLTVSAPCRPLHGAVAATVDADRAYEEINMQPIKEIRDADGNPVPYRLDFDMTHDTELFTKARRAYWLTILGPELAAAAGGVEAARATGAARVEQRGDCLIVQATDDVRDCLTSDWPARSAALRRWIWPHTIQNPVDAPDQPA